MRIKRSIGVRELSEHTSEIVRQVRTKGATIEITYRGKVVARLVPVQEPQTMDEDTSRVWTTLDRLAEEISKSWPEGVSAVEAVREVRREL